MIRVIKWPVKLQTYAAAKLCDPHSHLQRLAQERKTLRGDGTEKYETASEPSIGKDGHKWMLIPCKDELFFFFFPVWRSSSVKFAFHTTTCSCCINNSCAALPNQHVRFTDARTQTQQEPSQRVHRAVIDMHGHIRPHVPPLRLSTPLKWLFETLLLAPPPVSSRGM